MTWHQRAACRGLAPELFFTGRGESTTEAVAVCGRCVVRAECLAQGLAGERYGIWGGTTERERRRLRAQRRAERLAVAS